MANLQKAPLCLGFERQIDTPASYHVPFVSASTNFAVPRVHVYDFANIINKGTILNGIVCLILWE